MARRTHRALQLNTPQPAAQRPLARVARPSLEPGPGELLIDVAACAVCRTDLQLCEGDLPAHRLPVVPGHQAVGRVAALGRGVEGWSVGDRAGVGWLASACGECAFCRRDQENLCPDAQFTGWDRDGGYAGQIVARADFALHLAGPLDDMHAAPLLCGGVIGYRALRLSGARAGDRVGLYGFGASASLTIQVAMHWGCDVYVITRSQAEQERAMRMGAAWAGGYDERPPRPLDAAITFAPVGSVVVTALSALRPGATVAINAIHLDSIPEFDYDLLWGERVLRSVANYTRSDAREFLSLAAEIPITTDPQAFALSDGNDALARLKAGALNGTAVLETHDG
jgi:alcohol dehydrogenase, propanol-preferring